MAKKIIILFVGLLFFSGSILSAASDDQHELYDAAAPSILDTATYNGHT